MNNCKICGSLDIEEYYNGEISPLLKCNSCDVVWQANFPEEFKLIDFYSKEYYQRSDSKEVVRTQGNESASLNYKRSLYTYKSIIRNIGKLGSILDVGCGNNYLLSFAHTDNWNCTGLEISAEAARGLLNDGIDVFIGSIEDFKNDTRQFDLITMFHVLEHLSDPVRDLTTIKAKLVNRGVLIIEVPDIGSKSVLKGVENWWLFQPDEHLFYYNQNSLRYLMESLGFKITRIEKREGLGFSRGKNNESTGGFSLKVIASVLIGRFFWIKVAFEKLVNFLGYNNVIRIYAERIK